jgi:hypothetical protein
MPKNTDGPNGHFAGPPHDAGRVFASLENHPKVEMLATSSLTPNPRNARKHPAKQIDQLAANIRRFGFPVPILADQENMIVAGHGRWEAAKKLGLMNL